MNLVGDLVKKRAMPIHLSSDEEISFHNGKEIYIGLTISQDCVLEAKLSLTEDTIGLQEAYKYLKKKLLTISKIIVL